MLKYQNQSKLRAEEGPIRHAPNSLGVTTASRGALRPLLRSGSSP